MNKATALRRVRNLLLAAFLGAGVAYPPVSAAGELTLADTPLFLGGVAPNVFFELDDSGSMDWEFMTRAYWPYWSYDPDYLRRGRFDSSDIGSVRTDGSWASIGDENETNNFENSDLQNFEYLHLNGDNAYNSDCDSGRQTTYDCMDVNITTFGVDWRGRSAALNVIYYNPDVDYVPWKGPCDNGGTPCGDASFSAARSDPREGKTGYNQTTDLANPDGNGKGFNYEVWVDDRGYSGDRPRRGSNFNHTDTPNDEVDLWDGHVEFRVFSGKVEMYLTKVYPKEDTSELDVTHWGQDFDIDERGLTEARHKVDLADTSQCYNALGGSELVEKIFNEQLSPTSTGALGCRTITEVKQNAANWYQYSRRRAFVTKGAVADVVRKVPAYRYGMSVINERDNLFVEMPDAGDNLALHNTAMLDSLFKFKWPPRGTPLREGLETVGEYYKGNYKNKPSPIIQSCQKNFGVLFTDGFYNGPDPGVGDQDGDTVSERLADVAYKYYVEDLSPLADEVPPDPFDPATWQHMVTMSVSFGVRGELTDDFLNSTVSAGPPVTGSGDPDDLPDVQENGQLWSQSGNTPKHSAPQEAEGWGDASNDAERIDDMWHAAFNGRGKYISAQTPTELVSALEATLAAIAERLTSATAVALNTGSLNANSRTYQARFVSEKWTGELLSIPISDGSSSSTCTNEAKGETCPAEWDAADKLENQNWDTEREIVTYNPATGDGVGFRYDSLSTGQQNLLRTNPDTGGTESEALGRARLDYLRGDDSNEGAGASEFRPRDGNKLGDIIHSSPVFSGDPPFGYPDTLKSGPRTSPGTVYAETYSQFESRAGGRTPLVFVGANDGGLHGFNVEFDSDGNPTANSGKEVIGYVPNAVFGRLNELTSNNYNHNYYVDGDLTVGDGFFSDGEWHTVLVGTLRAGGQGVFALDVTDPSIFDETGSTPQTLVLWEFTDADNPNTTKSGGSPLVDGDVDLGYTYSRAAITRLANGKWVAIFGNGYNNTEADGNASATGNAVLYIVDLESGELIKKIDTGRGTADDPTGADRANGLATPTPIDKDGDFFAEAIYAGDLFGNLWKFDVSADDPALWDVAYGGEPLFVAKDGATGSASHQPITTRPVVGPHPTDPGGVMVYFGTGKYMEVDDNSATGEVTQTLYGIWDKGGSTLTKFDRKDLLEQVIFEETTAGGEAVRITSKEGDDPDDPDAYKIDWSTHRGWYMDLVNLEIAPDNRGERMVAQPLLRNKRIIFTTMLPSEDPCSFGGDSWIMELDASDGSRLDFSPFDIDNDQEFTQDDYVTVTIMGNEVSVPVSGRQSTQGIIQTPGVLSGQAQEFKYASGSAGGIDVTVENPGLSALGRQSWRQLR